MSKNQDTTNKCVKRSVNSAKDVESMAGSSTCLNECPCDCHLDPSIDHISCVDYGLEYQGDTQIEKVFDNWNECAKSCHSDESCYYWTWYPETLACNVIYDGK